MNKKIIEMTLETRKELGRFINRLDFAKISKHNHGYLRYAQNPVKFFIDAELNRYLYTINFINSCAPQNADILELGFFIPVVPIVLAKLGFRVVAVEKQAFYDGTLDELIEYTKKNYKIDIIDLDIAQDRLDWTGQFDFVMLLAVLEHLNGTPKYILEKANQLLKEGGRIIVEVPNVSSLIKRLVFLLKGCFPCASFEDYYHSEYPFSGHNREYSVSDLKYALDQSGFTIAQIRTFQHSAIKPEGLKEIMAHIIDLMSPPSLRPSIWAVAESRKQSYNL